MSAGVFRYEAGLRDGCEHYFRHIPITVPSIPNATYSTVSVPDQVRLWCVHCGGIVVWSLAETALMRRIFTPDDRGNAG